VLPAGTAYYKFGPTAAAPAPHWYAMPATIVGNTLSVTIVDGGVGDSDLAVNGTITDPGGAGYLAAPSTPATQIPTMDRWALLMLAMVLAGAGLRRSRRR
jgi:hypothetical protein